MTVIPLMVDLTNKKVVIIGGGRIAKRKVESLLNSGAELTVVSPDILPEINALYLEQKIHWKQKRFESSDLTEAFLAVVATNDEAVNAAVIEAAPPNSLINAASDVIAGNVHFPARFLRGKLTIAISTNGASPMLAKQIKQELESRYDENYEQYVDFLYEARQLLKQTNLPRHVKDAYLREFLSPSFLQPSMQKEVIVKLRSFFK
ncbi:NAD(P)-binding protein [Planococcus lenghuensis]|uniref:precorrin-2 dehydrogenase n=1 Tax=Planococcus lenghuensis TaxID=2213202 RepID=A0A1Q2KZF3_9BACL|nr:NAD(P)-binding protein [Planococcus lenghuensis]AQQ53580.1 hypothetical protein B0X71_11180 [Planococcus lenghuensis]